MASPGAPDASDAPAAAERTQAAPAEAQRQRRKRRWEDAPQDTSGPSAAPPTGATSADDIIARAKAVAAQKSAEFSGMLGFPAAPQVPLPAVNGVVAPAGSGQLTREVDINSCRNKAHLTRKATHEEICDATGVVVMIRGRYKPPGDTSTDERPLHLLLQGPTSEALDRAEERIRAIMGPASTDQTEAASGTAAPSAEPQQVTGPVECQVPVEVEGHHAGSVRGKVLGPRGSHIRYIEAQSGARVQLTGGVMGPPGQQPDSTLVITITAPTEAQLTMAKNLSESLVKNVKAKLATMPVAPPAQQPYGHPGYPPSFGGLPPPPLPPQGYAWGATPPPGTHNTHFAPPSSSGPAPVSWAPPPAGWPPAYGAYGGYHASGSAMAAAAAPCYHYPPSSSVEFPSASQAPNHPPPPMPQGWPPARPEPGEQPSGGEQQQVSAP